MNIINLRGEYLAVCSPFLILQATKVLHDKAGEREVWTECLCSRATASKCNLDFFLRRKQIKKNKEGIFLFTVKNINRAGESAILFCFLDSFRMHLVEDWKISSAGPGLCSFLGFLHLIADESCGNVLRKCERYGCLGLLVSYFPVNQVKDDISEYKSSIYESTDWKRPKLVLLAFSVSLKLFLFFLMVYRVVEFASYSDMKSALEKLDGTELNGRRIKLTEDHRRHRCVTWLDKILLRAWIWVVLMAKFYYLIHWPQVKCHRTELLSSSVNGFR